MSGADGKPLRGFAALTPEERRRRASLGGRSVPPDLRSFSRSRDLASEAGRKGGMAKRATKKS